ncbi:sugar dehydrogenase [Prauserella muralis]|uniref:Sugar dehydrogenase n=1 Tax=Prauserella muralis TaxID=588067 RepID=A0A2V4BBJ7_9PSEU|nr:sugar dehydrogenase [Prauserella muralis]
MPARLLAVLTAWLTLTGLLTAVAAPAASAAPALPPGFVLRDQPTGFPAYELTDFAYLPDGRGLLATGKQGGIRWVAPDGTSRQIATLSVVAEQDLGLVGLAVAPDYATSRHIYLARSVPTGGGAYVLRLARWTVTGSAEPTGITQEQTLLQIPGDSIVHGVTGIVAADDGTLWVSIGDVADFRKVDPQALRAQNLDQPQGKLLHLSPTGAGVPGNPYYSASAPNATRSKVFASGFRSPFRFSLDPRTGLPVVGDVGWNTWEEVNVVRPGANHGWPCWEGDARTPGYSDLAGCANVSNTAPLVKFRHGSGVDNGNSITGGIHYAGTSYPEQYRGDYFFGDYTRNKLWSLRYDAQGTLTEAPQSPPLGTDIGGPVKFAAAPNGDLVYADILTGNLRRLSYTEGNTAPVASISTSTDPETRTVTLDGSDSHDFDGDPLTYRWDLGDGTVKTGMKVSHAYAAGTERYTAKLTVRDPAGATDTAEVTVVPGNHSPVIVPRPPAQDRYAIGERVSVGATASDVEDGALTVHWTSAVLHCPEEATCHSHPGLSGQGSSFTLPFTDHPDSRMELTATVTDSAGVSATYTYTAWPREHRLSLVSNVPAALDIASEGEGSGTGGRSSALVTEGATVTVTAPGTATDGVSTFAGWSDGEQAALRSVTMGGQDLTLTANYTTPVAQRYDAEPGLRQALGAPTGPEIIEGSLYYQVYERGRLYWTAQTGTHAVQGAINARYVALGAHAAFGPPVTDERTTPDGVGRYNHFAGLPGGMPASVYWTPGTGAHAVQGAIRAKWRELGWENGPLGYPTTDESKTPDGKGRYNHFSKNSSIYWSPATGAHGIWGSIRERWKNLGWENGPLGYPTTDEKKTPDGVGRYNHFSKNGSVYWTGRTGARDIYGAIRDRWKALGWERSYLGYPTSGEFAISGGRRNNFQHGYITWIASTGRVTDRRY